MNKASGSRAIKWQVLWRGLRWRFGSAAMLFVVATLAIAGAAIGPMFLQSADSSALSGVLASAPAGESNLVIVNDILNTEARVAAASDAAVKIAGHGLLGNPILTTDLGVNLTANKGQPYAADLVGRTGVCHHLHFVAGRCPNGGLEVALSDRSASFIHRTIGETIPIKTTAEALFNTPQGTTGLKGPTKTTTAVIVGIYQPPSSVDTVYWAGGDYFPYGTGSSAAPTLDAIIATTPTVLRIAGTKFVYRRTVLTNSAFTFSSSIPWNMASVVRNRGVIPGVIASIRSKLFHDYALQVSTSLPSEMTAASNDDGTILPIILSIDLQVVLLALLVLYVLGRSSANARRLEADFARRRGFPRSTLLALAVSEPIALATAALPVGVLVAWLVLRDIGSSFFAAGTSVTLTWPSVAAGVGGYVAAVLAATLASYSLWRRSETQSSSRSRQCRRDRAGRRRSRASPRRADRRDNERRIERVAHQSARRDRSWSACSRCGDHRPETLWLHLFPRRASDERFTEGRMVPCLPTGRATPGDAAAAPAAHRGRRRRAVCDRGVRLSR